MRFKVGEVLVISFKSVPNGRAIVKVVRIVKLDLIWVKELYNGQWSEASMLVNQEEGKLLANRLANYLYG